MPRARCAKSFDGVRTPLRTRSFFELTADDFTQSFDRFLVKLHRLAGFAGQLSSGRATRIDLKKSGGRRQAADPYPIRESLRSVDS
jgi:hypothetical protein